MVLRHLILDMLYRLFYTVFSMSCMAVVLFPVVLLLRFCFRRLPARITVSLWAVFFIRAVCPLGLSSPVCLVDRWNRGFHMLLRQTGLTMEPDMGLLTGWRAVFETEVHVSVPYMLCTYFWVAGIVVIIAGSVWGNRQLDKRLRRDAVHLFDQFYQNDLLAAPVHTGVMRKKIYLPSGFTAKEMKAVIYHQKLHNRKWDSIRDMLSFTVCCIHWWNPLMWAAYAIYRRDCAYACDEAALRSMRSKRKKGRDFHDGAESRCAQEILNMHREFPEDEAKAMTEIPFMRDGKRSVERRAERILYYTPASAWKVFAGVFLVTVLWAGSFGTSALYYGGYEAAEPENPVFAQKEIQVRDQVIASCETNTPDNRKVRLELLVEQGIYQKGVGYQGDCVLRMRSGKEDIVEDLRLSEIFGNQSQRFGEVSELAVADYNEDGAMEVSVGQPVSLAEAEVQLPVMDAPAGRRKTEHPEKTPSAAADKRKTEHPEKTLSTAADKRKTEHPEKTPSTAADKRKTEHPEKTPSTAADKRKTEHLEKTLSTAADKRKTEHPEKTLSAAADKRETEHPEKTPPAAADKRETEYPAEPVTLSALEGEGVRTQMYYLVSIGEGGLDVISDPIYVQGVTDIQEASMVFSFIKGAHGVITTRLQEKEAYYVWDEEIRRYIRQNMTEEEIKARWNKAGDAGAVSGEEKNFYLRNADRKEVICVDTVTDSSGSRIIRKVELNPDGLDKRTGTKTMKNVEGYYCDLQWAETDGTKERFAVLTFNASKGRTFLIYDLEKSRLAYRQEDGNRGLQALFRHYGEDQIQFEENGAVVYSLMEISGDDVLTINFAANIKDDKTIRGTYQYKMSAGAPQALKYSRASA